MKPAKMALPLLILFLAPPSHGFYLAGSTVRTDTSLAELLFTLLQPGARAQKRHKKQVRKTENLKVRASFHRSKLTQSWARITRSLDLVIAFSSFIWLLPTHQETLVIRYLLMKQPND